MTIPPIIQRSGAQSATGFAREATPGVPQAANAFLPMADNTFEVDPAWFSPNLMQGVRDRQVYNLYGEAKYAGTVTGPLFPGNAMEVLVSSIGADAIVGWGVAAVPTTATSTTSSASTSTGATTVTVTSAAGFASGQQVVVDSGAAQEFRKVASIAGSVITLADALQYPHASGVAVMTGTTTTLSGATLAAATTVTVTSAAGVTAGTIVQVDVNSASGSTTSEIRKVTNVASNTLTLDVALVYAHGGGAQVTIVSAPFTHVIMQQNSLPTLTVEKNIGGWQSQQYAGCLVNKWELKAPVGNTAPEVTIDLLGQSVAVLDTPTGVTVTTDVPFVFSEANLTMFGSQRTDAANITATIENYVKDTYTYANMHGPSFLTPVQVHGSGSVDVVWSSLDNATYGDFARMQNGTLGALQFALVHPAGAGSVSLYYPQVALMKQSIPLKVDDVVVDTLSWEASRSLSGPSQFTVQATVVNSVYVAY